MRANAAASGIGLVLAACISILAGCNEGGDFGESVTVPQDKRTSLRTQFAEGKPLYFPKDDSFNVYDAQRSSTGQATADAAAMESGTAYCKAAATGVGTATAEFQLGQVVFSASDEPIEATVAFNIDWGYEIKSDPADESKPEDRLGLKAYVRGSDNRTVKRVMLADLKASSGPEAVGRLGPNRGPLARNRAAAEGAGTVTCRDLDGMARYPPQR
jgi:hypothetical protein